MNVLFLSLVDIRDITQHGIYEDLLREFVRRGHFVWIVTPTERKNKECTYILEKENYGILKVKTGNIQKVNFVEKGISTILLETQLKHAIKKYLSQNMIVYF